MCDAKRVIWTILDAKTAIYFVLTGKSTFGKHAHAFGIVDTITVVESPENIPLLCRKVLKNGLNDDFECLYKYAVSDVSPEKNSQRKATAIYQAASKMLPPFDTGGLFHLHYYKQESRHVHTENAWIHF